MKQREVIARYAIVRAVLVVFSALILIGLLAVNGVGSRWPEQPLTATAIVLLILLSAGMAIPVAWQVVARDRAALWIEGNKLRTAFWSCELGEVIVAELQRAEEMSEVVVRFGVSKSKRIDVSLLEGPSGQIAVRLNQALERRRRV
ncbi:MAG: hypothetical protein NT015_02045 [Alphaproteobacteria bacterium]|nr:hypothetical protein [Alphaproteobacteria bacterium]